MLGDTVICPLCHSNLWTEVVVLVYISDQTVLPQSVASEEKVYRSATPGCTQLVNGRGQFL